MKRKQRLVLSGIAAVALIFAACGGDSGNNGSGTEGDSSSSAGIYSSGAQTSSSLGGSSSSFAVSGSSAGAGSSSSPVASSSSAKSQSSSSIAATSSSSIEKYGTFLDTRDNQTYKTVVIGTQTWMAENLNYADSAATPNLAGNSWCYGDSAEYCAKYGRLYTWAAVMNVSSTYDSEILGDSVNHQGICPEGWHVPRSSEWSTLEDFAGDSSSDNVATYLKAKSGWYSDAYHDGYGTDAYGFSALPGGYYIGSGSFERVGRNGHWWTATESSSTIAYYRNMDYGFTYVNAEYYFKEYGRSLRCLKDSK